MGHCLWFLIIICFCFVLGIPEKFTRWKRAAIPTTVSALDVTVELVAVIDYSIYKIFRELPNVLAVNETVALVDLLLYYAHMTDIVSCCLLCVVGYLLYHSIHN